MEKTARKKISAADRIFGVVVLLLSIVIFLIILYPLWFVVIASISNSNLVNLGKVTFLPKDIRFYGFQQIMEDARIWKGYLNTLIYVVAGTTLNMVVTMPAAYALSRRRFKARNKVMFYFVFTMFFSGGIIPLYLTIRSLGIYNSIWAMVLPVAVSAYNLIVCRSFFESGIPDELLEAAKVDGANGFQRIRYIILPSLKPTIVILLLFALGGIVKGNFGLFYNIVGSNPILYPTTDIIETFVYRSTVQSFNFSTASAVGFYQSVVGFVIVMTVNYIVKKIEPDYSLF